MHPTNDQSSAGCWPHRVQHRHFSSRWEGQKGTKMRSGGRGYRQGEKPTTQSHGGLPGQHTQAVADINATAPVTATCFVAKCVQLVSLSKTRTAAARGGGILHNHLSFRQWYALSRVTLRISLLFSRGYHRGNNNTIQYNNMR